MSVLASDREESSAEFLKLLRDTQITFIEMQVNKPKRYLFYFNKLIDMSIDALSYAKMANSIRPEYQSQVELRENNFKLSIAKVQALVSQVEIIRKKFQKDGISDKELKDLSVLLESAIRTLKSVISTDKNRYKDIK